jgi:hypothetical protein
MKDRQIEQTGATARVPLLSPILHCIALPVIVLLRSAFGFIYLGPKSVFFAFSWAFTLFVIYAWNEPSVWARHKATCYLGGATMALYWLNLLYCVTRQLSRDAEHDHYSGTSHPIRVMRLLGLTCSPRVEMFVHLWIEPVVVFAAGLVLRFAYHEQHISTWLFIAAPCFWLKEALNYWFRLRQHKRQQDIFNDAEDTIEPVAGNTLADELPKATRKARVKRARGDSIE